MKSSSTHHERIAKMTFASAYPMYVAKVEKKDRTKKRIASGDRIVNRF